jgi:hypothetical protein
MSGKDHVTPVFICSHITVLTVKFSCTVFLTISFYYKIKHFFDNTIFLDHEYFLVVYFFAQIIYDNS